MISRLNRPTAATRGMLAALGVVLALTLAIALGSSATATGATPPATSAAKPTVVPLHGGWADSSGWNGVIERLHKRGYPVIAPANPLPGLSSDAAYLRSVLETIPGPIVLVGHSCGGAVITNAAVGVPHVKALVYIAAFAPDEGDTLAALVAKNPGSEITPDALIERAYPLDDGGTGVDLYIKAEFFRSAFAGDLSRATTRLMQAGQRPFSVAAFTEASGPPAWATIPSWYLVATDDHAIPPATQEFMADRAGSDTASVAASHVPMMSKPGATTALILTAALATS